MTKTLDLRPRVFVVNQPMRRDPATNAWVNAMDLGAAREHGELIFMLPAGRLPADANAIVRAVRRSMASFRPEDYLLLVGDPRAIAIAAAVAADLTDGSLNLLNWRRSQLCYEASIVDVYADAAPEPVGSDDDSWNN